MSTRTGGARCSGRSKPRSILNMTVHELREAGGFVVGTPEVVTERLYRIITRLGIGHLIMEAQFSGLPHELAMRSIEFLGKQVLPDLGPALGASDDGAACAP